MSEEVKGVEQTTPSALVEAIASTPEVKEEVQAQETQTVTAEQTVTQESEQKQEEESRVPYSRLKEVVDEKNWFKSQLEQQMAQRQQVIQQQPQQDPYAGMTAEERVFWQGIDNRIEKRAEEISERKIQGIAPMLNAGVAEITMMKVKEFRNAHPDIKTNSPDEIEIAGLIKSGFNPDQAYWAIMGPKGVRNAETQVRQQVKQQVAAKRQANVETSASVPSNAKAVPKMTFREELMDKFSKSDV